MEGENRFWYGLKSEVYVHICKDKVLAYDTKQKKCRVSEDKHVISLLRKAEEEESLGCVLIDEVKQFPSVLKWIQSTCKENMAIKIPYQKEVEHPVILRPLLSLNKDVSKIKDEKIMPFYWGTNVKHLLNSLTIYVNANCKLNCKKCRTYCSQIPFCTNCEIENGTSLSTSQLNPLLLELSTFPIRSINIFGGDVYDKMILEVLKNAVERYSFCFRIYIHYEAYQKNGFVDSQVVHLLIPAGFDAKYLKDIYKRVDNSRAVLHFVVETEDDLQSVDNFVYKNNVVSYQSHPYYTGNNRDFFENYVYMSEEDLINAKLSMREVFRNQKLNANNFGTLYVMPNGSIMARMDGPTLGYVGHDELIDVIYKELISNTAWRNIRQGEPCSQCVFQYLCPPLSNYESVIGKNDLCYMRNNKISV